MDTVDTSPAARILVATESVAASVNTTPPVTTSDTVSSPSSTSHQQRVSRTAQWTTTVSTGQFTAASDLHTTTTTGDAGAAGLEEADEDNTGNNTARGGVEGAGATAALLSATAATGGDRVSVAEKLIERREACHCNHKHAVHTAKDHCKQPDLNSCESCSPLICRSITKHSQSCFWFSDCSNASNTTENPLTTTDFPQTTTPAVLPKDDKSVLMIIIILATFISIGIFSGVGYCIVKKMRNVRPAAQTFSLYSLANPCYEPMEEVSLED